MEPSEYKEISKKTQLPEMKYRMCYSIRFGFFPLKGEKVVTIPIFFQSYVSRLRFGACVYTCACL